MANKPFSIQGADLTLGGVNLQAGTTGVVIPGITQATSYTVEEVEDTDDQTHQFTPNSEITVYDYVQKNYSGGNDIPPTFATYLATTDDEGYIDEIEVVDGGSYTSQEATSNAANDMWAWEAPPTYLYTYTQSDMTDPYGLYVSNGGTGIYNIQGDRTKWVDGTKFDNLLAQTPPMVFTVFLVGNAQQYLFTLYPNAQGGFLQGMWLPTPPVPSTMAIESIAFGSPDAYTQIPFRPKMRAGGVETIGGGGSLGNFEAEGSELYVPNEETIQINTFNGDGVKKAHITLDPNYPLAKMAINTQRSWGFNENSDFQMGNTWSDNGSGGGVIALTGLSQYLYDTINESGKYVDKKIILNSNTYNFTGWNSGGTLGVDAYINLDTDTGPNGAPVAVSYFQITGIFENRIVFDDDEGDYGVLLDNESFKIQVGNDINLYAGDDLRLEGNDVVHLRNKGLGEQVRITSQYGLENERNWYFESTGVLAGPGGEGSMLLVHGLESKDNDLYVGINNTHPSWPAISNILTSAVSRVNFVSSLDALPNEGAISFTGIQTWTQMNNVRYYYQKFDDTSISLYVDVGRTTPLDTTVFGTDYIQNTVNNYTWQQYSNNGGASNGWVDSVAYPGIVNVPLGAIVTSSLNTVVNETIVTLELSQFEGIYTIWFSGDSGTGRHQLGEDYVASWAVPGVATGSAVVTIDGYDVRLVPTTGSGSGSTAGRVKVESGLLELSSGATLGGIGIITPADDNFGIRTQFYPTVSAEAGQGTTGPSAFFDTTFVDDISVVQVGWQYNAGTQQAPVWVAATQAEFVGANLFVITVPGVTFEVGNTYTFRNPSVETDTWYFSSDRSFTTPAGGKIRHVNNDLIIEATGLTDVIVLRTASGELVVNSDGSLTFPDSTTQTTAYTGNELALTTVSKTYVDTPIALDLTKSINKLADGSYTLADGVEGQMMYLVRQSGAVATNITVTVANARVNGVVYTLFDQYPFDLGLDSTVDISTLIFTDGAWQAVGGSWN